jgi:hypothetical protein
LGLIRSRNPRAASLAEPLGHSGANLLYRWKQAAVDRAGRAACYDAAEHEPRGQLLRKRLYGILLRNDQD